MLTRYCVDCWLQIFVQVDSGEWGRGRVAELTAAGELMRAERDALLKLVQALRREYEAVQLAKESQHDELRALKDKMSVKVRVDDGKTVATPWQPPRGRRAARHTQPSHASQSVQDDAPIATLTVMSIEV